jgi:hypothetical protein
MEIKTVKQIIAQINKSLKKPVHGQGMNSMGCWEVYYDPYYLIGKCFSKSELSRMSKKELLNLIKLARYASQVFY